MMKPSLHGSHLGHGMIGLRVSFANRAAQTLMLAALRSRSCALSSLLSSSPSLPNQSWKLGYLGLNRIFYSSSSSAVGGGDITEVLTLPEVEKILTDVKADNVTVIPMQKRCNWADFMVVATGRSTWHVKNIAQSLIYKAKQKQRGAKQLVLPSVEGQEGGKWIVIDSGKVIVHALDEKARDYFNLESLWTAEVSNKEPPIQVYEWPLNPVYFLGKGKDTAGFPETSRRR